MEVISIPKRIIALLSETPGELVPYSTIWEHCWKDQFLPKFCMSPQQMNTLQANISYARKRLRRTGLGYIRNVRDHGYIFFFDTA